MRNQFGNNDFRSYCVNKELGRVFIVIARKRRNSGQPCRTGMSAGAVARRAKDIRPPNKKEKAYSSHNHSHNFYERTLSVITADGDKLKSGIGKHLLNTAVVTCGDEYIISCS